MASSDKALGILLIGSAIIGSAIFAAFLLYNGITGLIEGRPYVVRGHSDGRFGPGDVIGYSMQLLIGGLTTFLLISLMMGRYGTMGHSTNAPRPYSSNPVERLTAENPRPPDKSAVVSDHIAGDLLAPQIHIAAGTEVSGSVVGHEVVVEGTIRGQVFAQSLELKSTCVVYGDITHKTLSLESGCHFKGVIRRHEDPFELLPDELRTQCREKGLMS